MSSIGVTSDWYALATNIDGTQILISNNQYVYHSTDKGQHWSIL